VQRLDASNNGLTGELDPDLFAKLNSLVRACVRARVCVCMHAGAQAFAAPTRTWSGCHAGKHAFLLNLRLLIPEASGLHEMKTWAINLLPSEL